MKHRQIFGIVALGLLAATGGAFAQAKRWDVVRIATEGAYAPWNFTGAGGKLEGFEIDLVAELCPRMKVKCEIVAQDWDGIIPALNAGKYDAIMAGMQITDKRLETIDFSRPYARTPGAFLVPKDSPLAKVPNNQIFDIGVHAAAAQKAADEIKPLLKGKVVGVQGSTTLAIMMERLFPGVEIREYKTTEQHDLDLAAGRVDAIAAATTSLDTTLSKPGFENFVIAGPGFTGGFMGRGVAAGLRKSDQDLKAMLDDAIAAALADGTISRLSQKWFKRDLAAQ
ncbi:transporter substrate-binding domain-containing protein [Microvirga pudoricolor]|uniref:transporter substrate-binding domain-containing protein n=1 Tax=Microvirga pudoricolor TaxID=2778729 RepID=UPI0019513FAF|nr:transporter substrate-binding domain-containing protein [Microvirga pudoricolor]MBM6592999.1 transporter substrate-binding domain-containing protein [Microvirga pudoricolor]